LADVIAHIDTGFLSVVGAGRRLAGMEDPITIRRVETDDWRAIKALRLQMLEESPLAFITTYDEASAQPDSVWIERCTPDPGDGSVSYAAFDAEHAVGMAVGLDKSRPGRRVVAVVSVYVAPTLRRRGLAGRLMDGVEEWARERAATATSLWVVDGNDAARRFYAQRGYRPTFDRQKIRTPPVRWETRMEKSLRR
jgi:GNAT superfamily N-acetyltransferase